MKATIEAERIFRGPQGGRYWGYWLRDENGVVVTQDAGFATKKSAVASATKVATSRGLEVV